MWATAVRGQTVRFWFIVLDSSGVPITGATLPVRVIHEFAPSAALATGNATAADGTNLPGWYYFEYAVGASEVYGNIFARGNAAAISGAQAQSLGAGYYVSEKLALVDASIASRLAPTTSGRTLDVTATGEAGIDWSNVGAPTATLNLSGTTIKTVTDVEADTQDIQSRIPTTLDTGRMRSSVEAMAANTLTASALAADAATEIATAVSAPTAATIADAVWDEALSGHVTAGSAGAALTASGSASDPLANQVTGYATGTAGGVLAQLATGNATIPVRFLVNAGTLYVRKGESLKNDSLAVIGCTLFSGFNEASHPVQLLINYGNGTQVRKTIALADISTTATNINVNLSNALISASTAKLPVGNHAAQIVAYTDTNAEATPIAEFTLSVSLPVFEYVYSATDTI